MEEQFKKRLIINFLVGLIFITGIVLFYRFIGFLFPLILALAFAILAQKMGDFLANKIPISQKASRVISVILIFVIILLFAFLALYLLFYLGTDIFDGFGSLLESAENLFKEIKAKIANFGDGLSPEIIKIFDELGDSLIIDIGGKAMNFLSDFAAETFKKVPVFMLGLLFSLVAGCYIAKDFPKWKNFFINILNDKQKNTLKRVGRVGKETLSGIFKGYFKLFFLTFFELFLGFLLLGIKHSFALAVLIAFIDLMPILGTGIALIPWGIVLVIFGDTLSGVGLILLSIIITSVRSFLEPKIIGKQIGIHPLVTLISIFLGLRFFGFIGLITFPLLVTILFNYYRESL